MHVRYTPNLVCMQFGVYKPSQDDSTGSIYKDILRQDSHIVIQDANVDIIVEFDSKYTTYITCLGCVFC